MPACGEGTGGRIARQSLSGRRKRMVQTRCLCVCALRSNGQKTPPLGSAEWGGMWAGWKLAEGSLPDDDLGDGGTVQTLNRFNGQRQVGWNVQVEDPGYPRIHDKPLVGLRFKRGAGHEIDHNL